MCNKLRIVSLVLAACWLVGCQPADDARTAFVRTFFEQYPEATLQDIYKGSFQDTFGPAHLLSNRDAVKNYILREIAAADTLVGADYVPCGWEGNFLQVNLKVVADGRVPVDVLVNAFMGSAQGIDTTLTPAFMEEWKLLQQTVRSVVPDLPGFRADSILLAHLLAEGKYVVHHSKVFNTLYHPHYLIVRKDLFEALILPKL